MVLFGIGTCLAIIGLIGYMIVDAFRVLKYGLEGDDEDED